MLELTPDDIKKVLESIGLVEDSLVRIESERELIKENAAHLKEKYKIPTPVTRKVAQYNINKEKKDKAEAEFDIVDYLVELSNN